MRVNVMTNFLPEEDQEYLESKSIKYELRSETVAGGTVRRCVVFRSCHSRDNCIG